MAKLVAAGVTLRTQINNRFPKRDKSSDGWIGDSAHQARPSDHNSDSRGWVHALDIDKDFGVKGDAQKFANQLASYCRLGLDHGRVKYIVFNDKIASATAGDWKWRGSGYGHLHHIHISFNAKAEKDGAPFILPILKG